MLKKQTNEQPPFVVIFTLVIIVAALFATIVGQTVVAQRSTETRTYAAPAVE